MKVANGTFNEKDSWVYWEYIPGHTSEEASGILVYMILLLKLNDNFNFLVVPSSVIVSSGNVNTVGIDGYFWSSSLDPDGVGFACIGIFTKDGYGVNSVESFVGFGVRGVVGQ